MTVPKKAKITHLVDKLYNAERQKFKDRLATARRVTIGLDIWTKKGLTAAFLAISACYYCTQQNRATHILLRLEQIAPTHTLQSASKHVWTDAQRTGEYLKKKF